MITQNFLKLVDELNLTDSAFCRFIGWKRTATFYRYRKGEETLTYEVLLLTKKRLPHFNINFLIDDQEPMFLHFDIVDSSERFDEFLSSKSVNNAELNKNLGYTKYKIDRIRRGEGKVEPEVMKDVKKIFNDLDLNSLFHDTEPLIKTITPEMIFKCLKDLQKKR